jgi:redox-sensing transcriptional repressor
LGRVSEITLRRLSRYARCLQRSMENGLAIVTSGMLAGKCGISPAAVRKDFAFFGEFGTKGSGYDVPGLLSNAERLLGIDRTRDLVLVGADDLSRALFSGSLEGSPYRVVAALRASGGNCPAECCGVAVEPMERLEDMARLHPGFIAVLSMPSLQAQECLDRLARAGCRAVLNLSPEPLHVPSGVAYRFMDFRVELDMLAHSLTSEQH